MAKKQTARSRNARRAASPPPDLVDSSTFDDANGNNVDGKTRVMQEVAKLTVRGLYKNKDDDEAEQLGAVNYAPALGITNNSSPITSTISNTTTNSTIGKIGKKGGRKSKDKLTAKQRKRQIDAIAKAESLKDVLTSKVETSKERFTEMKLRKKDWEDFNKNVVKSSTEKVKKAGSKGGEDHGSSNPFALLDVE